MSGGKETPRQKMIGMMYLVLTALLALNVSSTVLEKFAILNSTLKELILENERGDSLMLVDILKASSSDPTVVDAKVKAQQIRDLTKETMKKLAVIKEELGKEHDGKPMAGDELIGNTNIAEEKMVSEKSTLAQDYEKTLVNYNTKLAELSGMTFEKLNKTAVDFPELKNEKGEVEHADKSFIEFSFEGNPTMPAITGISQMQTEILDYEGLALKKFYAIAKAVNFDVDIAVPMVIGPNIVAAGAKYDGKLFMATSSSGISPEMFRNGAALSVTTDPANGIKIAKVEFTAQGGSYDAQGNSKQSFTAEIRPGGGKKPLIAKIDYTVVKPVIKITTGNLPTLYMNCCNRVNIEVPVLGASYNPTFKATGATVESGDKPGKVTIVPTEGKVSITVSSGGALIGTEQFDVKKIPKPRYVARSSSNIEIDMKKGIASTTRSLRITADAEDNFKSEVPTDANYMIRSMEVVVAMGTSTVGSPLNLTNGLIDIPSNLLKPGARLVIQIKTVKRGTCRGEQENVDIVGGIIIIPIAQ